MSVTMMIVCMLAATAGCVALAMTSKSVSYAYADPTMFFFGCAQRMH